MFKSKPLLTIGLLALCGMAFLLQTFSQQELQARTQISTSALTQLEFVNQRNNNFRIGDFNGKVVVLNFAFTGCSVYCPIQISQLRSVHKQLSANLNANQFEFVSITLTPVTDSVDSMLKFAERFSIDEKNWHFATGEQQSVDQMVEALSAKVIQTGILGEVDHTTNIYVIDHGGLLRSTHQGVPVDSEGILHTVLQSVLGSSS